MDSEPGGCYGDGMRLLSWLLLGMLLALPAQAADDDDDEERAAGSQAKQLRAIDEAAESEADHPGAELGDPLDDESDGPADGDDDAPLRSRPRSTPSTVPPKSSGGAGTASSDADEHY